MTKKPFNFTLKEDSPSFSLPYPSIASLEYIFTDKTDTLIDTVYNLCTPEQQQVFEEDFILLNDLTNSLMTYHYQCIADKPRLDSFFEQALTKEEEAAKQITDPNERRQKLQQIEQKREQVSPKPKPLMRAVLAYAGESDRKVNFNSWLLRVGNHLGMSINEVNDLDYDLFIEASDQMTIANDIQICHEIEQEQERKKQEAMNKHQGK